MVGGKHHDEKTAVVRWNFGDRRLLLVSISATGAGEASDWQRALERAAKAMGDPQDLKKIQSIEFQAI